MNRLWRNFLHVLDLARLDLVLSAVGNIWLMVFLAFALEPVYRRNVALVQVGLGVALGLTAVIAGGLTIGAMTLNDLLDARHDRTFFPARPTAAAVKGRAALFTCSVCLIIAIIAAAMLGPASAVLAVVAAVGVVFYNLVGRFVPSAAVITLAVVYALTMLIPNPELSFAWPVGLTVTHVMACATVRRGMPGSRPPLHQRDAMWILLAWLFISLMLTSLINGRHAAVLSGSGVPGWIWVGPLVAAAVFVAVGIRMVRSPRARSRAGAQRFAYVSNLWLMVYAALWLFSAELYWQGGVLLALLVAATTVRPGLHRLHEITFAPPGRSYRLDVDRPVRGR